MKIQELSLFNNVWYNGVCYSVLALETFSQTVKIYRPAYHSNESSTINVSIFLLEPIPIDKGRLYLLGFKGVREARLAYINYERDGFKLTYRTINKVCYCPAINGIIKHVHELQNIFFWKNKKRIYL